MKWAIVVLVAVGTIILGLVVTVTYTGSKRTESEPVVREGSLPLEATSRANDRAHNPKISQYHPPNELPSGWEDFFSLGEGEQLSRVTEVMGASNLPGDVLRFFEHELYNRRHQDVMRNNMANALVGQETPNPKLHELFIKMLEDETEDPVWRDYCIQFLSESLKSTSEPKLVKETLARYAKGKDSKSGTAIVHLAFQEGEGRVQLDESFSKQIETQLTDPQVDLATKVSILGVIGQRKDVRLLPLVRTYAKDRDASLKRCAIAALGQIGTQEDIPLIQACLADSNRAVQLAAKAAEERLRSRISKVVE